MLEFGARKCFYYLMKKKEIKTRTTNYFTILMWQGVNNGEKMVGLCVSNRQLLTICHIRIVTKKL